ncbi:hypothetical protein A2957_03080 [Candidatus Roizmanbacteria bacterium RIFCSPLOWO2_01_FULL_38_11]|uniref:Uncharacterized protein n=1 Tax=Candidatus Roizmanbacteria bacterium RIFCSPLOWO2_01_FULL_38_11 TaxID=1802060 RepID=A0A1F7ILQ1_9BACT|nr:MAG: hypothetical protein A2957_03080 [Candidatus Roizmanbacteria bacterium RIFCSPLOWO2_01_FULL_38_11]
MDPVIDPETIPNPTTSLTNGVDTRIILLVVLLFISIGTNIVMGSYFFRQKRSTIGSSSNPNAKNVQRAMKTASPTPLNISPTKKDYSECFKTPPTYSGGGIEIPNTDLNGFSQKCPIYLLEADLASMKGQIINKDEDEYLIFTDHALYITSKGKPSFVFEELTNAARSPLYSKTFITNQTVPIMIGNQRINAIVTISTLCKDMSDLSCDMNDVKNEKVLLFQPPEEDNLWLQLIGQDIKTYIGDPAQWEENILRMRKLSPASTASSTSPTP